MNDDVMINDEEKESADESSEEALEPIAGRGLPSYRPWDWIAGYLFAALVTLLMFGLSERMYDIAQ